MNCQECVSELATGSLRAMQPGSEIIQHCASCPDCGPLATLLRDREYNAATVLNNLPPMSNPISVAENAGHVARRRRLGKVAVFVTGSALAATIWISLFVTGFGRDIVTGDRSAESSLRTETIPLSCLSAQQAGEIINPYVRSHGSAFYTSKTGLNVITVRATPDELAKVRDLIIGMETNPAMCRHSPADVVEDLLRKFGPPRPNPAPVVTPTEPTPPIEPTPERASTRKH